MTEENNILFDRFLNGELSGAELKSFQNQLTNDFSFKSDFELYESLIQGVKMKGKEDLLAEIKLETSTETPNKYKPPSSSGFGFLPVFGTLFMLSVVAVLLLYADIIPSKDNLTIEKSKEWLHQWDEQINALIQVDTIYDTVYQYIEIEDPNMQPGDTIFMK